MVELLNYRFAEEEFSTSYIPNRNIATNTQFQGMWCGAWKTTGIDYKTDFDWNKEQLDFINCYNFNPAFIVYSTSTLWNKYWSYRPTNSFVDEFRDGGDACGISKDVYPSASDPYIIGLEFCHTTAKFTSFKFKNRLWDGSRTAKDIEILGSKDGVNFVSLIKYTNTQFTEGGTYTIDIPTNKQDWYKSYRFKTTSSNYGSGWVTFGYITPVGKWKSYKIQNLPLFEKGNLNLKSPVDGSDISAPIIINGKTVYAAYGTSMSKWASPINCKIPNLEYNSDGKAKVYFKQSTFSQPVVTSNNHSVAEGQITILASVDYGRNTAPFYILGGSTSTTTDSKYWQNTGTANKGMQLTIKFPYLIGIKGLSIYTRPNDNYTGTLSVYTSPDKSIKLGDTITTNAPAKKFTIMSGTDVVWTDQIFIDVTSHDAWYGLQNLQIVASNKKILSNSSDYNLIEYYNHRLLDWQITDGSYTLTSSGTITFTVPRGVKNVYINWGSYSGSYSNPQYHILSNAETGDTWMHQYRRDVGYEDISWSYDEYTNYVAVTSGKTYTLTLSSTGMANYPTIQWGKAINNTTPTLDNR